MFATGIINDGDGVCRL